MLLDSDNEDNDEMYSKRETFVEEKWFQFTEQDNWNTRSFVRYSKRLFKRKEAPNFVAHEDFVVWFIMRSERNERILVFRKR